MISYCCLNGDTLYVASGGTLYSYDFLTQTLTLLGTLQSNRPKGIFYYNSKIYYTYDTGTTNALYYFDLSTLTNTQVDASLDTSDEGTWCATDGSYIYCGYLSSGTYRIYRFNFDGTLVDYKTLTTNTKFGQYPCTIDSGDFLCSDGTRLNISDLFVSGIETYSGTANYVLDGFPLVKYGTDYYKGADQSFPSPYESRQDDGEALYKSFCFGLCKKESRNVHCP